MSMVPHIQGENERQQMYKGERKAKRKPTKDGRTQQKLNIYKKLKMEAFDEPNDDNEASDPTFSKKRGKGVVVSMAKKAKKGLNVKTTSLKRQYNRKESSPYRIIARSPPGSFTLLMRRLNDDQKAAIREMGFASMLDIELKTIPTVIGYWAVKNFDHNLCTLHVRDASLKVTNKTIHDVLGVPMGDIRINALKISCKKDLVTKEFRKQFPVTKKRIYVSDVIGEMVKQEKGGRLFKLNFLVLFVTVMVEGIKCATVNQNFLTCIRKLEDVRNMDWCEYILECLVRTRKGWKPDRHYNGPLAFLVVFYAHSIKPKNIGKETSVPVINSWTSHMLRKLEEEEFNTGYTEELGIRKMAVVDIATNKLKDRKTSLKTKRKKHDTLELCMLEDAKNNKDARNNKEAPENVSDVEGDLDIENDGELNRYNTQNMAEELCTPHVEHGVEGLYNKCDGWVLSSGRPNGPTIKELGHASPIKSSSPGIVCVHGYTVKESVAPILDEIFKKHGDIAAESIFTIPSMRSSFLEGICEVVRLVQSNDAKDKMEEVERYVSMAEQAKIDVSWLRAPLEAMQKTKEAIEKSSSLVEMKINAILVKRAAQKDERQRCAELLAAQERFVEADRTVKVLHFVEKYLGDNLVKSEAEKNFLVRQPIL